MLVVPSLYLEGSKSWWSLIFFRFPFCNCFNCCPWWINSLVFHPQVKWKLFCLYFKRTQWLFVVFNLNFFHVDTLSPTHYHVSSLLPPYWNILYIVHVCKMCFVLDYQQCNIFQSIKYFTQFNSTFVSSQAWCTFISESEKKANLITEFNNVLSSTTLKRLEQLIEDKKNLLKKYRNERFRIESAFKQESDEIDRLRKTYQENAKESESSKRKYEEVLAKDKFSSKDWERSKDRYVKTTLKLHQNHNDYVLALKSGNCHQGFFNDILIPTMLNSLQYLQEEYIAEW